MRVQILADTQMNCNYERDDFISKTRRKGHKVGLEFKLQDRDKKGKGFKWTSFRRPYFDFLLRNGVVPVITLFLDLAEMTILTHEVWVQ